MKIPDLKNPGWGFLVLTAVAGAAAGFAAGYVAGRDPAAARRVAQRTTRWLAGGTEQAALRMAQLREHLGDLWAEAREASAEAVDAADFARRAATAAAANGMASGDEGSTAGDETGPSRRAEKPGAAKAPAPVRRRAASGTRPQARSRAGAAPAELRADPPKTKAPAARASTGKRANMGARGSAGSTGQTGPD